MVIYDIVGLEWSDDSLFFFIVISQAVGAFIGIPVAGEFILQAHSKCISHFRIIIKRLSYFVY